MFSFMLYRQKIYAEDILYDLLSNDLSPGALLEDSEQTCLMNVYSVVDEEYLRPALRSVQNEDEAREAALQIIILLGDMRSITRSLSCNVQARERFITVYPKWKEIREETIKKLKEVAIYISTGKRKRDWWKLYGYSTSFIGGFLSLVSLLSAPFTLPMSVARATLAFGSSYFVHNALKVHIDECNKITEKDKKYFEEMKAWLKCTAELEDVFAEVLKTELSEELMKSAEELVVTSIQCNDDDEQLNYIEEKIKEIFQSLPKNQTSPERTLVTGIMIKCMVTIVLLNMKKKFLFDFRSHIIRSFVAAFSCLDNSFDAARLTVAFGEDFIVKGAERTILGRAFAAFGMAINFTGIVLTSIDIKSGSQSKHAEMISNAAEELRKEADAIEKIYKAITS